MQHWAKVKGQNIFQLQIFKSVNTVTVFNNIGATISCCVPTLTQSVSTLLLINSFVLVIVCRVCMQCRGGLLKKHQRCSINR